MGEDFVLTTSSEALKVILMISAPLLISAMLVGIVVSILQAVTQINEATLTFIPKMAAIVIVLVVLGPWMLQVIQEYTQNIFINAAEWVRQ